MRIIGPLDQKPFYGVVIAAVSGLMLGGAMKPDLNETALSRAPQLLSPVSADRVEFVDSRSSTTAYRYGTPDWVVGTDWLRPAHAEQEPLPGPIADDGVYEVAAWEPPAPAYDPPAETVEHPEHEAAYPSMGGDILQGVSADDGADVDTGELPLG